MSERLTMTPPDKIRSVWPAIRDRIAAVSAECREPWIAEDVFHDLAGARAFLWGTENLEGFLILQIADEAYGRTLHCWIVCNASGEPPQAYWDELVEIARSHGCFRITFENDRPGFQRHIEGLRCRYLYSFEI